MEYAINISLFGCLGIVKAAEMISKAGFTCLDYIPPFDKEDWLNQTKEALKIFEANGLRVHQIHAPSNHRYGEYDKTYKLYMDRCAESMSILGAKYMVIHGDELDFFKSEYSPEAALEYNHNLYLPYVEDGKKNGYKAAFENLFEFSGKRRFSCNADDLMNLINSFEKGSVACCWDTGHANISFGGKAPEIMREFGSLIECTHFHDNTGADSHQMPMTGAIDWKKTMDAFKDIGYNGVTSIEYNYARMPVDLIQDLFNITYKYANRLWTL